MYDFTDISSAMNIDRSNNWIKANDIILDYFKFVKDVANKFLCLEELLNSNNVHILNKNNWKYKEGMYMDRHLGVIWQEGEPNTKFIEKKMIETYSQYPIIGDYDINPMVFEPEILELIRFSIEDED